MPPSLPPHSHAIRVQDGPKRISSSGGSFFKNPSLRVVAQRGVGAAAGASAGRLAKPGMELDDTHEGNPPGLRYTNRRGSHVEFLEVKGGPGMQKQTVVVETEVVDDTREIHSMTLSTVTTDRLVQLFIRLDTDGSGSLDVADFETGGAVGDEANAAVWHWIQDFFTDGKKTEISLRDFIQGWKNKLWAEILSLTEETPWEPGACVLTPTTHTTTVTLPL
jgi:hypothetical protein